MRVWFGHIRVETSTQSSGARTLESSTQVMDRAKGAGEMNQVSHDYSWRIHRRKELEPAKGTRRSSRGDWRKPRREEGSEISKERNDLGGNELRCQLLFFF